MFTLRVILSQLFVIFIIHELIFFYKKNIILHLFLRNLETFVTFAEKVQYYDFIRK